MYEFIAIVIPRVLSRLALEADGFSDRYVALQLGLE
jgi:hypothetical protein